ncbi:hypothetical protein [uncultured Propionibacterium sp.]|uniref:acyltransferase n=1 Tax=uncultured Propionibacterium sp. TaxID=218066 RepID=UPI00292EA4DB|nr:hypothetical protein [uncultured Propionibacterium sp.]
MVRTLAWLLPASAAKNRLLTRLGHHVSSRARAAPSLVWDVDEFTVADDASVLVGNVIRHLSAVEIGEGAMLANFNLVSAHPAYKDSYPEPNGLFLEAGAKVLSRHQLDCSAAVRVRSFASIAGHGTNILTHSVDLKRDAQAAYPVTIGERSFVGTRCLLLGGAELPPHSVLAAGSTLLRPEGVERPEGLYAGSPAVFKKKVDGAWFHRRHPHTNDLYVPSTGRTIRG